MPIFHWDAPFHLYAGAQVPATTLRQVQDDASLSHSELVEEWQTLCIVNLGASQMAVKDKFMDYSG